MQRSVVRVIVVAALLGILPSNALAGWRSADRRQLEDDVEEPYDYEVYQGHDGGHRSHDDGPRRFDHRRDAQPFVGTQPYWGTMRPYWNAGEPPGVIHRQPRTAPLKVQRAR